MKTHNMLVYAVENAEVGEIKRAAFRALTWLRAATIKESDTMARLETQAIDAYNDAHHFRAENPVTHLHEDKASVKTDKLKAFHFLQDHGKKGVSFVQLKSVRKRVSTKEHASLIQTAVEDELATEMKHDLEMNFNKIAPFGKEDNAKELEGAPGQGGEEPGHLGGRSGER